LEPRRTAPTVVVPCFEEAARLDVGAFVTFAQAHAHVRFVMVDDGSRDATRQVLEGLAARSDQFTVLSYQPNAGKAEAVRRGILHALEAGATAVGFWDADLATPLDDVLGFAAELDAAPAVEVVLGSRVKLLGRHIDRDDLRHYFGRVAATAASLLLRLPVYDTQCGAKLFRVGPRTRELFATPFETRWAFDVEILARWLGTHPGLPRDRVGAFVVEVPLRRWTDVAGSKLRARDFLRTPLDLFRIWRRYRRELRADLAPRVALPVAVTPDDGRSGAR
jgi:glycosyltransferase involved in cell wall biosynthesis